MRKPLIATATACLLAFGLTGCGNQSNDATVGQELDDLLDKMSRLDAPRMPYEENKLVYTYGTTIDGVEVPGSVDDDAAYIDQAVALVPAAEKIASSGNAHQKKIANSIIASILADEGAYLITVAQHHYQQAAYEVGELRKRVTTLQDINQLNQAIGGDRAESIAVIRTGKIDATTDVQGLTEAQAQTDAARQAAEAARAQLADTMKKIASLRDEIAEYESLELKLSNEALGSQGSVHFDKLDQATTAAYEAEMADSKVEQFQVNATVYTGQAELAESDQASGAEVVDALQTALDQIEQEKRAVAKELAELEAERQSLVKQLTARFTTLDAQMQARGFARMKMAQDRLDMADQALNAAQLGSDAELEQLGICLLRARSLQQQSLAATSYAATLGSLAAAGPDALGSGLHDALTERIGQMNTLLNRVADDTQKLKEACDDKVRTIRDSADGQSDDGKAVIDQTDLYFSLLSNIASGGTGPGVSSPGSGGDVDRALLGAWRQTGMSIDGEASPLPVVMTFSFLENGVVQIEMSAPDASEKATFRGSYTARNGQFTITMPAELGGEKDSGSYAVRGNELTMSGVDEGEKVEMTLTRIP